MAHSFGVNIGTRYGTHYSNSFDRSGWDGWLYPVLFIVLPLVAGLMIVALIACNVYEYYQKRRRLEQYKSYSDNIYTGMATNPEEHLEVSPHGIESTGGYNEGQFTYNTLYGNNTPYDDSRAPVRPLSGWIAPHM